MTQKFMRRLALILILAVSLWLINPPPAAALSVAEYFHLSYDPVSFSKNEINGSEAFHATILGHATCSKNLPVSVSEAGITSRVIAEHTVSGTSVTLNSSYTVTIKPFPSKEGDTIEINQVVPLTFPAQAESGDYNITGQLIEAKVKVVFVWGDVSEYLPEEQHMGSVKYTAPEPTPESVTVSAPEPTPPHTETEIPASPEYGMAWWVWLIVATAAATTLMNIIWFLRHRISTTAKQPR